MTGQIPFPKDEPCRVRLSTEMTWAPSAWRATEVSYRAGTVLSGWIDRRTAVSIFWFYDRYDAVCQVHQKYFREISPLEELAEAAE